MQPSELAYRWGPRKQGLYAPDQHKEPSSGIGGEGERRPEGEGGGQGLFQFSAMKDGFVGHMKQLKTRIANGLGHTINQANVHPSTGGFVGGKIPNLEVPTLGKIPLL